MADEEKQWRWPCIWRKPQGREYANAQEEAGDPEYSDEDDANAFSSEWGGFIFMPACEHVFDGFQWPEPMRALLDWLLDHMREHYALATTFDAPSLARQLKMPIPNLLAARDALVRLRVLWFFNFSDTDENLEDIDIKEFGINYRFHTWECNPEVRWQVWYEEERRYAQRHSRPQEARDHLTREPISSALRWQIYARDAFKCRYCGASGVPLALDHLIPVLRGGTNEPDNLITSCQSCNSRKGAQWPEEH